MSCRRRIFAALTWLAAATSTSCSGSGDNTALDPTPTAAPDPEASPHAQEMYAGALLAPDASPPDANARGAKLGDFRFTYYWMAREKPNGADGEPIQLYTRHCEPLAKVAPRFVQRLELEGTGQLSDGRTLNVSGICDCPRSPCFFHVPDHKKWGVGVAERPLAPFRSVAVDPSMVAIGTVLYIPELDGLTMPGRKPWGGFVHDGCVIADDRGAKVDGQQLDFFAGQASHYRALDRRHRLKWVTVYDGKGRCEKKGRALVPVNRNST